MDESLRKTLQQAYAKNVADRESNQPQPWKLAGRQAFLELLKGSGVVSLLEVGAGTGQDAAFFASRGLEVLATDLTEENVAACRRKGIRAEVMDACDLKLPAASFDAVYSLNCLLHLPKAEFPVGLDNIKRVLKPGGLFYLGLYGGEDSEGIYEEDTYEPKRFFSFWTDEGLKAKISPTFKILRFETIDLGDESKLRFQSLILCKA